MGGNPKAMVTMSGCSELVQKQASKNSAVKNGEIPSDSVDEEDAEGDQWLNSINNLLILIMIFQ